MVRATLRSKSNFTHEQNVTEHLGPYMLRTQRNINFGNLFHWGNRLQRVSDPVVDNHSDLGKGG